MPKTIYVQYHLLGSEINNKRLSNGTHPSQIKKTCPHCGKTCAITVYGRCHGNRCKKATPDSNRFLADTRDVRIQT